MASTPSISAEKNVTFRWLGMATVKHVPHVPFNHTLIFYGTHMYKIHIKVKDNRGNTTLVLFNGFAEKLLDNLAAKLINPMSKGDTHVPLQIESLCIAN